MQSTSEIRISRSTRSGQSSLGMLSWTLYFHGITLPNKLDPIAIVTPLGLLSLKCMRAGKNIIFNAVQLNIDALNKVMSQSAK